MAAFKKDVFAINMFPYNSRNISILFLKTLYMQR